MLGVRGPFGRPWPVDEVEGADVVIVAGGIGLAPLRPAILRLLARRERYGRVAVLYGGRAPDQLLYPEPSCGSGTPTRHRRHRRAAAGAGASASSRS